MRDEEDRLLTLYRKLPPARRKTLIEFAQELAGRTNAGEKAQPLPIARSAEETVVMAIRRLTRTYPMLDRRKLMAETSHLISEHAVKGRTAREVIDELEVVFQQHFERTRVRNEAN